MSFSNQFLSEIEDFLRQIIRDEFREAQLLASDSSVKTPDRIGNINLAVEVTKLARQTIYNLASKRAIPHSKCNGKLIFCEKELREWLVQNPRTTSDRLPDKAQQFVVKPTSLRKKRAK